MKLFKVTPSFDDYLKALRQEKIKLAYEIADRIKRERKRKSTVFSDENWGKPVNVQFDREGDILGDISVSQTQQYPKQPESLGANCFGSETESNEPKPKSNQDRLKDIFNEHAE